MYRIYFTQGSTLYHTYLDSLWYHTVYSTSIHAINVFSIFLVAHKLCFSSYFICRWKQWKWRQFLIWQSNTAWKYRSEYGSICGYLNTQVFIFDMICFKPESVVLYMIFSSSNCINIFKACVFFFVSSRLFVLVFVCVILQAFITFCWLAALVAVSQDLCVSKSSSHGADDFIHLNS